MRFDVQLLCVRLQRIQGPREKHAAKGREEDGKWTKYDELTGGEMSSLMKATLRSLDPDLRLKPLNPYTPIPLNPFFPRSD